MNPAILALGGASMFLLWMLSGSKKNEQLVTINNRQWKVEQTAKGPPRMLGNVHGYDTYWMVSVPAGPGHAKMPILSYSQFLNDQTNRKLTFRYPGVTASQYAAAMKDFNVQETMPA